MEVNISGEGAAHHFEDVNGDQGLNRPQGGADDVYCPYYRIIGQRRNDRRDPPRI